MVSDAVKQVTTLTFDVFGTILDLSSSLVPSIDGFLEKKGSDAGGASFWADWRSRQRIEQYQDTLLMSGHSGYLETCRRAFIYCLRLHGIAFTFQEVDEFMKVWRELDPFEDAVEGLRRLSGHYRLVALSNGDAWLLNHLINNRIGVPFSELISVDRVGVFKPHPSVYRAAARALDLEPLQIMMVAAHSFDVMGARACGYRGAYVDQYGLPFEETPYLPDLTVKEFSELADTLLKSRI